MAYTQMNIRIDANTKAQGDRVFAAIGYSPTEVARTVWSFAAAHENDSQAVIECIEGMRSANLEHETRQERRRLAMRSLSTLDLQLQAIAGTEALSGGTPVSDKKLLEEALVERLSERGLW